MATARQLLGPGGALAQGLSGYEPRAGQLDMADAVERALHDHRVLICEAGTGTGKTLAYLVPALQSGKKVVVSTATRALQQQLHDHDLPLLERTLGLSPRVTVMKGLSNYVCLRRFEEFRRAPASQAPQAERALAAVEPWVRQTETGDITELEALPEDEPLWAEITASSETRLGASCPHFADCFVTRMRAEAEAAELIIVNHHLFFADLALRGAHPGRVLPHYDAVIFDEAHQLEDTAAQFFGVRLSSARLERVLRDAGAALVAAQGVVGAEDPARCLERCASTTHALFAQLARRVRAEDPRLGLELDDWQGELLSHYHALDDAWLSLTDAAGRARQRAAGAAPPGLGARLELAERRCQQLRDQLASVVEGARGWVSSVELTARSVVLKATPIDVAELLRERVFEATPSAVLTSATLTTPGRSRPTETSGGSAFGYLRARLGLTSPELQVDELLVPSPFDFDRQALLYTPRDLPAPSAADFTERAAARITELVELVGGGGFVLTTSLRSLRALHAALVARLPGFPLLLQGEAPKPALLERFKAEGNAVLVATLGFWEGVDVPGRELQLVVLEKIPFVVPSDPMVRARSLALERAGGNAFMDYHLPAAALTLKQGFGRLIRTRTDYGIVALLDERVHRRGYGRRLLAALPPARRASSLDEVRAFWSEASAAR